VPVDDTEGRTGVPHVLPCAYDGGTTLSQSKYCVSTSADVNTFFGVAKSPPSDIDHSLTTGDAVGVTLLRPRAELPLPHAVSKDATVLSCPCGCGGGTCCASCRLSGKPLYHMCCHVGTAGGPRLHNIVVGNWAAVDAFFGVAKQPWGARPCEVWHTRGESGVIGLGFSSLSGFSFP
jgi:hypothetical protein